MILNSRFKKPVLFFLPLVIHSFSIEAQNNNDAGALKILKNEIVKMDSLLFDIAFNKCDFDLWNTIFADSFEFYDDRTGLNTDRAKEERSFKERCAKSATLTRKLISTEVHPLNGYGAVQLGTHEFYLNGEPVQIAKFIHLWQKIGERWIVSRIVSYDHKTIN